MQIVFKSIFICIFSSLLIYSISGQERKYSIITTAGKVSISSTTDDLSCVIKIGKKVLRNFECDYSPQVLKHVKQEILPFDEVIVFQEQTTAQSCEGSNVFFLGLNKNGNYEFSETIEYCGGPKPLVIAAEGKITITFPRFKSFRGGFINKQIWIYEKGKIREIKQTRSRTRK